MRIVKFLLVAWLAALAVAVAAIPAPRASGGTQNPQPTPTSCPVVIVSCVDTGTLGYPITFTANISGGDSAVTPTFKWTVPRYSILSGDGTSSITVDTTGMIGSIVATVVVKGYDPSCMMEASCTTNFIYDPGPNKIDEYGDVTLKEEKMHLEHFTAELQKDPYAQGYFVCYGGRHSRRDEAKRRCARAMRYMSTRFADFNPQRFVTVDGGFREQPAVELWVVSSGAVPPGPYATPTVDPSEVRPPSTPRRPRRRGRR